MAAAVISSLKTLQKSFDIIHSNREVFFGKAREIFIKYASFFRDFSLYVVSFLSLLIIAALQFQIANEREQRRLETGRMLHLLMRAQQREQEFKVEKGRIFAQMIDLGQELKEYKEEVIASKLDVVATMAACSAKTKK